VPELHRLDYAASGGREIFLSFDDNSGTLFGLLRLRIQTTPVPSLHATTGEYALVRELHVYGPEVPLKGQRAQAAQHKGLGKSLLHEAERIVREECGLARLLILSGVGAKEYYRNEFGYRSEGYYMVKDL
jgi:elongator complex protein 3